MLSLDIIGRLCSVFVAMFHLHTIGRLALCLWPCYLDIIGRLCSVFVAMFPLDTVGRLALCLWPCYLLI